MKTILFKCITLVCISLLLINCSDDDNNTNPQVNALDGFFSETGFENAMSHVIAANSYTEAGFTFVPLVNGKIKAIVAKNPIPQSDFRVTIWDVETETVLRTEYISIPQENVEAIIDIEAISLVKDKAYLISFNSNDYYQYWTGSNPYPVTIGDIKITGWSYSLGMNQSFPGSGVIDYCYGDISFMFQKD